MAEINSQIPRYACSSMHKRSLREVYGSMVTSIHDEAIQGALQIIMSGIVKHLAVQPDEVRQNAEVIVRVNSFMCVIQSGNGRHKFTTFFDSKGNAVFQRNEDHHGDVEGRNHNGTGNITHNRPCSRQSAMAPRSTPIVIDQRSGNVWRPDSAASTGQRSMDLRPIRQPRVIAQNWSSANTTQRQFHFTCAEINKRSVGKAILQFCGNEGTVDCDNKAVLRRLLQAVISHVHTEPVGVWRNAEVEVYDDNLDVYKLTSGAGKHRYMATVDENDQPIVERCNKEKCSIM